MKLLSGKRLLFLGGSDIQIPGIRRAQELGAYVISCDYLPDNPGHQVSDEYRNVSTTDKEAVLSIARELKIDGISAYASDPAALTAAYVSGHLGIPGNSFEAVNIIADKVSFRKIQHALNIPAPRILESGNAEDILPALAAFPHGAIIKPADTSGSKGVFRIHAGDSPETIGRLIAESLSFSRSKILVIEEYLVRRDFLMSGDFMIENGKIVFYCFGDVHFNDKITGLVPRSISIPTKLNDISFFESVMADLQKMIDHLEINTGVFNCDVILTEDNRAVVIDIGARNGGNLFNDIISLHTGEDLIGQTMLQTLGVPVSIQPAKRREVFVAHNVIHSTEDGIFDSLWIDPEIEKKIFYRLINVKPGDEVKRFVHSGCRLGLVLIRFDSFEEMHRVLTDVYSYIRVRIR